MNEVIYGLVDGDELEEYKKDYGKTIDLWTVELTMAVGISPISGKSKH